MGYRISIYLSFIMRMSVADCRISARICCRLLFALDMTALLMSGASLVWSLSSSPAIISSIPKVQENSTETKTTSPSYAYPLAPYFTRSL